MLVFLFAFFFSKLPYFIGRFLGILTIHWNSNVVANRGTSTRAEHDGLQTSVIIRRNQVDEFLLDFQWTAV